MKIQLTLFFSLSFLILATPSHSAAAFDPIRLPTTDDAILSAASGYPVVDVNGKELVRGFEYYMSADVSGRASGQGVKLTQLDATTPCPSDVVQGRSSDLGNPVVFTPADEEDNFVFPSTFQTISFNLPAANEECADKQSWKVEYDEQLGQNLVKADEAEENVSGLFKIELMEWTLKAYKLTYCPPDEDKCYDVGRYYDRATSSMRLALTNTTATLIVFKKT